MAPDSFPGCWTCRVRHRKCDLAAPACKECSERRVPCHGYGPKPSWMDGALREQQERAKIKTAVKQNAQRLRKLHIHARQQSSRQNRRNFDQLTEGNEDGERQSTAASAPAASPCSSLVYEPAISHGSELPDSEQNRTSNLALGIDASRATLPSASITPHESALLMHYLDQVFYWQFPYFCSLSKLGNRGWLFRLLSNRGPLYHAALSLSALHQSAICGREIDYLQNQKAYEYHSSALRNLCEFLSQERSGQLLGDETLLSEFLACGTMLISFEVLKGGKYEWQPHLDAITSILRLYIPGIRFRSRRTSSESDNTVTSTSYISNNDEQNNGLEFLVINVLWFDILACVSAGREPHLPYKRWLDVIGLEMSDVMGCQSWVMSTIGDIAQLNIWKQEKAKARVLSIPQLTFRSQEIAERLENGIIKLENLEGSTNDNPQSIYVSHIFALAALVLLHTIVSGPWPSLNEIREAVEKSIILLQRWPKICSARGIVWALCILGCTAETPNQAFFDELMTKLDRESGRFGNIGTVLKLMKQYWDTSTESSESWMHTAFQTGTCVLLI